MPHGVNILSITSSSDVDPCQLWTTVLDETKHIPHHTISMLLSTTNIKTNQFTDTVFYFYWMQLNWMHLNSGKNSMWMAPLKRQYMHLYALRNILQMHVNAGLTVPVWTRPYYKWTKSISDYCSVLEHYVVCLLKMISIHLKPSDFNTVHSK